MHYGKKKKFPNRNCFIHIACIFLTFVVSIPTKNGAKIDVEMPIELANP